jgi:GR25 family glycosyltransferase involved in LPS biosynthesis
MRSFIIHMPGDAKRAPNAARLLKTLPEAELVDAVIGREVVAAGGCATAPGTLHQPHYPFPLSPGEIGCFLSHRRCWQKILDEGLDCALIAEDDMETEPAAWGAALALAVRHAGPGSFIRLPAKRREAAAATLAQQDGAQLFLPKVAGLQTVAQVVGREAARRLLGATAVLDRPVDTFLQMHWIHGQQIHTILPNGVSELTEALGGSTIQKKKSGNKLSREFQRALYRARVSYRPQKP